MIEFGAGAGRRVQERHLKDALSEVKRLRVRIAELKKDLDGAKEARDELQAVFDRCLESDQRAIKAWQEAHPGTDLVWPDRTKMVVWLLEKGNSASARIAELEAENAGLSVNQCLHDIHGDESGNLYCPRIAELEAALLSAKQHFVADEPLKAFVEICAALGKQE